MLRAPAEDLPFEDDSFDVAVSTLVLCAVDDQPRALRELRRVLRPGGRLLLHRARPLRGAKAGPPPGPGQLAEQPGGSSRDCNRPTLDSIRAAGFSVEEVEHGTSEKAPPFVRPLVVGAAAV